MEQLINSMGEEFRMLLLHTQFNKKLAKPWEAVPNKRLRPEVKSGKGTTALEALQALARNLNVLPN